MILMRILIPRMKILMIVILNMLHFYPDDNDNDDDDGMGGDGEEVGPGDLSLPLWPP